MQRLKAKLDYEGGVGSYKLDLEGLEGKENEIGQERDYGGVTIAEIKNLQDMGGAGNEKQNKIYQDAENQINNLISKVKHQRRDEREEKQKPVKFSASEVDLIYSLFQESPLPVEKIDHLIKRMSSLKNLSEKVRHLIISTSSIQVFEQNDVIYKQGSRGDCYYLLIRGCVTLLSSRPEFGNYSLFLKNFYDGDMFGEQPVIASQHTNQSNHTIEGSLNLNISPEQAERLLIRESSALACEQCIVLCISNQVKLSLYDLAEGSKEYLRYLQWLQKLEIFKYTEVFYLLQMVFSLEKRVFKYGEYLTRSGQKPEGMFIVTKGQCLCVFESIGIKKADLGSQYSRVQKQPKNFQCGPYQEHQSYQKKADVKLEQGNSEDPSAKAKSKGSSKQVKPKVENLTNFNPAISVFNHLQHDKNRNFQSTRIYVDDVGQHMPNYTAFKDNIIFNRLVPGDNFGMRTLLPQEEILKRIEIDIDDLRKGIELNLIKRRSTIKRMPLSNFQKKDEPYFTSDIINLFRKVLNDQKTSALSIFADSNEVECLVFKPHVLNCIPENQKDELYSAIAANVDPDNPTSLSQIIRHKNEVHKWDKIQQDTVLDIRKSQFMEKHQGVFKR